MTKEPSKYELRLARKGAESEAIRTAVSEILASPLSGDDAGRIGLINNRRLQATYAGVCIGETELVRATHIRFVVATAAASEIRGRGDA